MLLHLRHPFISDIESIRVVRRTRDGRPTKAGSTGSLRSLNEFLIVKWEGKTSEYSAVLLNADQFSSAVGTTTKCNCQTISVIPQRANLRSHLLTQLCSSEFATNATSQVCIGDRPSLPWTSMSQVLSSPAGVRGLMSCECRPM